MRIKLAGFDLISKIGLEVTIRKNQKKIDKKRTRSI